MKGSSYLVLLALSVAVQYTKADCVWYDSCGCNTDIDPGIRAQIQIVIQIRFSNFMIYIVDILKSSFSKTFHE
jgi:hypothetical protein